MTPVSQLLGLEGRPQSGSAVVTDKGVRLPDEAARFVMLENWYVLDDDLLTNAHAIDVLWGYNGTYSHWLRAGGSTALLPVNNLNFISLRSKPGETITIYFSWYK